MGSREDLIAEYRACHEQVLGDTERQWQTLAVAGAIYAAVILLAVNVFPNDSYPIWVKMSGAWIALVVVSLVNVLFWYAFIAEVFWQQVAFRRMLELESVLGFRLMTHGFVLIKRAWEGDDIPEWIALPTDERQLIERQFNQRIFGLVPRHHRPEFMRPLMFALAVLELVLLTSAIIVTIFLANR